MSPTREQRRLMAEGRRRCSACHEIKSVDNFYACGGMCKACRRDYQKRWRAEVGYERLRRSYLLKNRYGMAEADYEAMLRGQGGGCAICGGTAPGGRGGVFSVDHDHACCPGKTSCGRCIRGLLCSRCNTAIGSLGDDPNRLIAAAAYLIQYRDVLSNATEESALMPTVRTTMQPDQPIEVGEVEYLDLKRQGLLLEDEPATAPAPAAAPATPAKKTSGAAGSKES